MQEEVTEEEVAATMDHLEKLGYIEDSGTRRPDQRGRMQIVYRISVLGHVADHYLRQGLSFEAAMEKAKTTN